MRPNVRLRFIAFASISVLAVCFFFLRPRLESYLPNVPKRVSSFGNAKSSPYTSERPITRTLVIPKLAEEATGWVEEFLGNDTQLTRAIYTVDDPDASLTVPENKGHEVMVYLTYLIDHYHNLSDVTMFMHSHQIAWHNNDLLDSDAVTMIRRLSSQKVIRDGYVNMRCHLDPGCPDHIHPVLEGDSSDDTLNIPEAVIIGKAWLELFPNATAPPKVLSQPCCGQFAVSKERVLSIPLSQWNFYRDWLLQTTLTDSLSGRVWEYVWQYIFGGFEEFCPVESVCYCDGYGICFGGEAEYQNWFKLRLQRRALEEQLGETMDENNQTTIKMEIGHIGLDLENKKNEAFERGRYPHSRALEVGRNWSMGDGF